MEYFTPRWSLTSLVNECPEDIAKLSISLNGENNKISQLSLSTEEVNVKMETVKNILQTHYTDELKSAKKSNRRIIILEPRVKLEIYKNPAIIDCKIDAQEEEDDKKVGIYYKAKRLSLNLSSVVELAYNKCTKCTSAYSVEAT